MPASRNAATARSRDVDGNPRVMSIVSTQMSEMSRRSYTRCICERVSMPALATAWSSSDSAIPSMRQSSTRSNRG